MTLSITALYIVGATTFSIITLSITTFSIMTLSLKGLFVTLSITDIQHK
jgi:hypothetical protein